MNRPMSESSDAQCQARKSRSSVSCQTRRDTEHSEDSPRTVRGDFLKVKEESKRFPALLDAKVQDVVTIRLQQT